MPSPRRKQILLLLSGVALLGVVLAWWMHKAPEKSVVLTVLGYTTNELTQELTTELPDRFLLAIIGVTNHSQETFIYWDNGGPMDYAVLQKGTGGWQDTGIGSGSCGLSAKSRTLSPGQGFTFVDQLRTRQQGLVHLFQRT